MNKSVELLRLRNAIRVVHIESLEARQLLSATLTNPGVHAVDGPAMAKPTATLSAVSDPSATPADIFPPPDDGGDDGDVQLGTEPVAGQTEPIGLQSPALPTTGGSWTFGGPGPISGGQVPGGGVVSGRVTSIAPSLTDPNTFYVGAAGGGVWKTTNAGVSYTALTDAQTNEAIGAVAIAPSNPNIIYAGTGEANNAADCQYGDGVLKSADGGATWTLLGTTYFNRNTFSKIVVDPTNANVVYGTTSYGINGVSGGWGIWKSTDGGSAWTNTTNSISSGSDPCSDLVMDPTNPLVLYAAMGNLFGNSFNGLYKTTDGGTNWSLVSAFPGDHANNTLSGRIALGISSNASVGTPAVYASVQSTSTYGVLGVYKSADGGTTWSTITPSTNYMGGQGWYDQYIAVSPTDLTQSTIFVGGAAGSASAVMESTNGGSVWTGIATGATGNNGPHADHHAAAFDASGRFLDGNDGGVWRLDNPAIGSILWTDLNSNLGITQFQGIAIGNDPTTPTFFGGSQDNGTSKGTSASVTFSLVEGGDGGLVSISPNNSSRIYHIAPVGSFGSTNFFRRSTDGGTSWSSVPPSIGSDSSDFYPPFAVDPSFSTGGNDRLLLGTNHLYETTNSATNWTTLTTNSGNGWTQGSTYPIDTIATLGSTIYASAGGHTYVSTNDGGTWAEHDVSSTAKISQLIVDPTNSQIAYAVLARFTGTLSGKVYRTTNGSTWVDISGDLPDVPVRSIVLDPTAPGTGTNALYVGTDTGVYTSANLGTNWAQLGTNFPVGAAVYDLRENSNKILAAGTHGRGLWYIPITVTPSPLVLTGSNYLELDGTTAGQLDVWAGTTNSGSPTSTYQLSQVSSITDAGTSGNDTLTVDFSLGNPLAATTPGVSFNTTGTAGGTDALILVGDTNGDTYNASAGQILASGGSGATAFTGVSTTFSNLASESVHAGTGLDVLTVTGNTTLGYTAPLGGTHPVAALTSLAIATGSEVVFSSPNNRRALLKLATVSNWAGQLDLKSNDLDIAGGSFSTAFNLLQTGYNGGVWTGPGLASSSAATDSTHLTALGLIRNNQSGSALFTAFNQFDNTTPGAADFLVKCTYYADANLSGADDGSDYSLIDNGYLHTLTGWFNGDFNYDTVINGSDYTLIDNAFNNQGTALAAAQIAPAARAAVKSDLTARPASVFSQVPAAWFVASLQDNSAAAANGVAAEIFAPDGLRQKLKQSRIANYGQQIVGS